MLDNIIICRLYRTIWRPKKATKSATFEIPNWFHKSLKNQRHICSTFIRKFVNDVWSSKQWTSDSLEQRLFLRPFWPYSLHTFSLVSLVKKYATCKAKMAFQKAFVHGNLTFIVFLIPSLTFFIMNVEKIQSSWKIIMKWSTYSVHSKHSSGIRCLNALSKGLTITNTFFSKTVNFGIRKLM